MCDGTIFALHTHIFVCVTHAFKSHSHKVTHEVSFTHPHTYTFAPMHMNTENDWLVSDAEMKYLSVCPVTIQSTTSLNHINLMSVFKTEEVIVQGSKMPDAWKYVSDTFVSGEYELRINIELQDALAPAFESSDVVLSVGDVDVEQMRLNADERDI